MTRVVAWVLLAVTSLASVAAADPAPAPLEVIYAITEDEGSTLNSQLLLLDRSTGAGQLLGITPVINVLALAVNSSGSLYATDQTYLYRIDPGNGQQTLVAQIVNEGFAAFWQGLAFDENDVLYAISRSGYLVTVDTTTAETQLIGDTSIINLKGLAFDPSDGTLYASHGVIDAIYTIDKNQAIASLIGFTDLRRGIRGIAFTGKGDMYGSTEGSDGRSDLIAIDKTTAHGTPVGSTNFYRVAGMTIRPDLVTAVSASVPRRSWLAVSPNVPNPFNPATVISYQLDTRASVTVEIYDVRGTLIHSFGPDDRPPGAHTVTWDGRDAGARELPSGVYLYRVIADGPGGTLVGSRKMTMLK